MDANAVLERHLEEAEGIGIPQLRLDAEGLLRQLLELDLEPLP
ncbi:MAG TPA: hypothetical protein VGP54_07220 [Gaiellaceae bacterium]|nr:hypothetical protein [Gaiellaceae bacterium]